LQSCSLGFASACQDTSLTFARGINEMEVVGLEATPSVLVKPPRVKASPCALECKWLQTVQLKDIDGNPAPRFIAFGQVIGIHIDENFIKRRLPRYRRNEANRARRLSRVLCYHSRRAFFSQIY